MQKGRGRVTQKDISVDTGFSLKTVGLALRQDSSVSESTIAAVLSSAKALGYERPHAMSDRLVIALIVSHLGHIAYSELVRRMRHLASVHGLIPLVVETGGSPDEERRLIEDLVTLRVSGFILISPRMRVEEIDRLALQGHAVVTINKQVNPDRVIQFAAFQVDNEYGGRIATASLIGAGYTRIGYLAGPLPSRSNAQRLVGYQKALAEAGFKSDSQLVVEMDTQRSPSWPRIRAGFRQCLQLLSQAEDVDAIFAYNDELAVGALLALGTVTRDSDIAVVGCDNTELGEVMRPSLTSVSSGWESLAPRSIEILLSMLSRSPIEQRHQRIQPYMVYRSTTPVKV